MDAETPRKPLIPSTMKAETRRKIEEMVMDLLTKAELEKATEFTIRLAASERLGIDLSDSHSRLFVRKIVDSYLISIAKNKKLPQVTTEAVNEPPQEFKNVAGVTRKNDDSELVICELSNNKKVTVGDYKGRTLVSIREYFLKDGKQLPTPKGMSLSSQQWSTFKNSVPAIEEAITELAERLRRRSGHSGWKNVPVQPVPIEPASIEPVPIEIVPIEIVRFDGKNYQVWAEQVELLLKKLKIDYVLTESCPNATLGENNLSAGEISKANTAEKRWVNDDLMCRRNILGHLSDSLFKKYANRKMSAKELWEELRHVYLIEEYGTKRSQVKKYIEFQMVDEKAVADQIQELNCIRAAIGAAGMHIDENFHVSVIISKLPLSWKDFCIKLMREEYLPLRMLMGCVTKEEESRNGVKQVGEPPSDKGGIKGADIKPPPGFPRKFQPNVKNITCNSCGQKGHVSKNCCKLPRK